jgi:hypothetical protein|tara:strand:- start:124 stop:291 length:168 start_codon:yes stop_codon:yes gene_type:complete
VEAHLNIQAIKEMLEAGRAERSAESVESMESPSSSVDIDLGELSTLIALPPLLSR